MLIQTFKQALSGVAKMSTHAKQERARAWILKWLSKRTNRVLDPFIPAATFADATKQNYAEWMYDVSAAAIEQFIRDEWK